MKNSPIIVFTKKWFNVNEWKIFKVEMIIKTISTTFRQIFCKIFIDFMVIIKCILDLGTFKH